MSATRLSIALAALALVLSVPAAGSARYTPNDPLIGRQWYLQAIHAFDFWADPPPALTPVRVAVIDSGIDAGHPEFAGRIALARSFVPGDISDREGHGTFVAGIIAATTGNGIGIAGIGLPAQLLVAKVVRSDGTIAPAAEARAIRWAVDNGARVINLSLGGLRNPRDPSQDTYSGAEQDAVAYAAAKGAVVVAAVGNGDDAPSSPWDFASYPAALPHVVGVSALAQDGSVPVFSNRDSFFNDLSAPGVGIVSTLPRALTASRPACVDQGYSVCGPAEFRTAEGTSYAAAQVSGAAVLLLSLRPTLTADQVTALLERSASDANVDTGCAQCALSRDRYSGWGELDVQAALQRLSGPIPPRDRYEPNDDAGSRAFTLWGRSISVAATVDFWDDQIDVYRVKLARGQSVSATLEGPPGTDMDLALWRPGTQQVSPRVISPALEAYRLTQSVHTGARQHFFYRAPRSGWFYVEVKIRAEGAGPYRLRLAKSPTF